MNAQNFLSSLRIKKGGNNSKKKGKSSSLFKQTKKSIPKRSTSSSLLGQKRKTLQQQIIDNSKRFFTKKNELSKNPLFSSLPDLDTLNIPSSSSERILSHKGIVTTLDLNEKGSRLVSGGGDYRIKMFDFHSSPYPIKEYREPVDEEGEPIMGEHLINRIEWSKRGDCFVCIANYSRFRIFNRECRYLIESPRGDMYLRDKNKTKGHTGYIYDGHWHSSLFHSLVTCSIDGTLRLWDASKARHGNFQMVKFLDNEKKYIPVSCCCWGSANGPMENSFMGIGTNGTIQSFDRKNNNRTPIFSIKKAHIHLTHSTCILSSSSSNYFMTRGGDGDFSLKLWDFRQPGKGPLFTVSDLPNRYAQSNIIESPDGKYILCCCSNDEKLELEGSILTFERDTFKPVAKLGVGKHSSAICVKWNDHLNQLFIGCSDHSICCTYDSSMSKKGILFPLEKKGREVKLENLQNPEEIYVPHALRQFQKRDERGTVWAKNRRNKNISHEPEKPSEFGVGEGGKLGTCQTEQILREMGIGVDKSFLYKDPREELWEVAEESAKNPRFVDTAYKKTQPEKILRIEGEEEFLRKRKLHEVIEPNDEEKQPPKKKRKLN